MFCIAYLKGNAVHRHVSEVNKLRNDSCVRWCGRVGLAKAHEDLWQAIYHKCKNKSLGVMR